MQKLILLLLLYIKNIYVYNINYIFDNYKIYNNNSYYLSNYDNNIEYIFYIIKNRYSCINISLNNINEIIVNKNLNKCNYSIILFINIK